MAMAPHSNADITHTPSTTQTELGIPVLIVGGGPAGLLQAHLLSKLGVQCLVIERYPTRLAAPKAHAISPRTFEICRQFGIDVAEIRRLGTRRRDAFWVHFVTSLMGVHVGDLPYERMDVDVLEDTPLVSLSSWIVYLVEFRDEIAMGLDVDVGFVDDS